MLFVIVESGFLLQVLRFFIIMGGRLIFLLNNSSRSSLIKPLRACLCMNIKRYGQTVKENNGHVEDQRAPSLAEEFKRVAEDRRLAKEQAKVADEQGVASHTVEKAYDGTEKAFIKDSKVEYVKEGNKEHEGGANYHKAGE